MKYQEWLAEVPAKITDDPIWKTEVYRLGLFLSESIREDTAEYITTPLQELLENVPMPDYQFTHHALRTTDEEETND